MTDKTQNDPITIVLADDHPIMRQGLAALLSTEPDFHIVGEAENGRSTIDLIDKLCPDILVLDVQMPGLNGLEVVRQLGKRVPKTRSIVFSMYGTDAYVMEAYRAGAWGYLLKGSDAKELIQAIHAVTDRNRYLSKAIPRRLHDAWMKCVDAEKAVDPYDTLSPRERDVLQLVIEGKTNQEVGDELYISSRTVEIHRANALRKLNLHTNTALIRYAITKGLLPPE
jgi:two-component system response regulator NreC